MGTASAVESSAEEEREEVGIALRILQARMAGRVVRQTLDLAVTVVAVDPTNKEPTGDVRGTETMITPHTHGFLA